MLNGKEAEREPETVNQGRCDGGVDRPLVVVVREGGFADGWDSRSERKRRVRNASKGPGLGLPWWSSS